MKANEESFFDSRAAILASIPHRPPFLFIDSILEWNDEGIVCNYCFKEDEYFFKGHYPNSPIVPGVILCESAMQAGAIFASKLLQGEDVKTKVPVVGRMNDVKFRNLVRPGQVVEHHISFKEKVASALIFKARVLCEGKTAASFEFIVSMVDRPDEDAVEDAQ